MKGFLFRIAVGAFLMALVNSISMGQSYSIIDLGTLGGSFSNSAAINNLGQIVGQSQMVGGGTHAFLWSSSEGMQDLGTLPGGTSSYASAINDNGIIVGTSDQTTTSGPFGHYFPHAFAWSNGVMTDLGVLQDGSGVGPYYQSSAVAINSAGQITGSSWWFDGWTDTSGDVAYIRTGGVMTSIQWYTRPHAISPSGTIVGESFSSDVPFMYQNGTITPLSTLGIGSGRAMSINAAGQITGSSEDLNGVTRAVLWQGGNIVDIGTLGGSTSAGASINDLGSIVGSADTSSRSSHAFIYQYGTMQDLNAMLSNSGVNWTLTGATGINDMGQIVGNGFHNGQQRAFLLNPTALAQQAVIRSPSPNAIKLVTPSSTQLEAYDPSTQHFVKGGAIDPALPTVVLTHGFSSSPTDWPTTLAKEYPGAGTSINVVAWDWHDDAGSFVQPYTLGAATSRTVNEGAALGEALVSALGGSYNKDIHFIGHSLGTLVNAKAVNVFNTHTNDSGKTQVTLFDDAEVANIVTNSPSWALSVPTANHYAFLDNYISAFGNLQSGPNATNVILSQTQSGIGDLLLPFFHGYPPSWYGITIPHDAITPSSGYAWAIDNPSRATISGSNYYEQAEFPSDPLLLQSISAADAQNAIDNRNKIEFLQQDAGALLYLTFSSVEAPIQTVGQVTNVIVNDLSTQTAGSSFRLKLMLGSTGGAQLNSVVKATAATPAGLNPLNAPTPSYAWVPVSIPDGVQSMSFDFIYQGLDPSDYLAVGIGDVQLFALEASYVPDSTLQNSGLIDVSQWAGQDVELFFGNSGIASAGMVTIQDIAFQVPEPSCMSALMFLVCTLFSRRRERRAICYL